MPVSEQIPVSCERLFQILLKLQELRDYQLRYDQMAVQSTSDSIKALRDCLKNPSPKKAAF